MPIRVEHGPNLAPIGQLAYQTGQLEYRNKRRTELERLAMQQAEMRQRAQMQQQQIAANLRGQRMSHMGAMQKLALGQQFGQFNAQQANQWNIKLNEQRREHEIGLAEQVGRRAVDRIKLAQGLADEADWKKAEWEWLVKTYDTGLNSGGKQNVQGLLTDRFKLMYDKKLNEQQRTQALEQNMGQLQEAKTDPRWRVGLNQEIGYSEGFMKNKDGNNVFTRTRVSSGKGDDDWTNTSNRIRMVEDPDNIGADGSGMIESEISEAEWFKENTSIIETDGVKWIQYPDASTGKMVRERYEPENNSEAIRDHMLEVRKTWNSMDEDLRLKYPGGFSAFNAEHPFEVGGLTDSPVAAMRRQQRANDPNFYPLRQPNAPLPLDPIPNDLGVGEPAGGPDAFWPGGVNPVATPKIGGPAQTQEAPVAPRQTQAPVSKEFEAVPAEYHPRKQWGDTPIKSTPEGYKALGRVSIYAIAPEDQQAVYQERQREAKVLPWDSEERGGVSPETIANALKNGPLEYGAKVDLSKDNSPFADAWKKATGQDVLVVNDELMWKLLSPNLTEEQQAELQQQIYTQKKEHFEYYGEPSDFPSDNMIRFQQRMQGVQ